MSSEVSNTVKPDKRLAQIVRVSKVEPIKGAENIELAYVLGWQCAVKKSEEFKAGSLGIYFCLDSILDQDNSNFSFLNGKRIKTREIKLNVKDAEGNENKITTISQGLLGPLEWLKSYNIDIGKLNEGDDVTEIMKVQKFVCDEEIDLYKDSSDNNNSRPFPRNLVPKTDEEQIQDTPRVLHELIDKIIMIKLKYEGTSTSFIYYKGESLICGRNKWWLVNCQESKIYFDIEKRYDIKNKMRTLGLNIAVQGETIGTKINGNYHKLPANSLNDFFVFRIFDIDSQSFLQQEKVNEICTQLGLKTVTLSYHGKMPKELCSVKALLEYADNQKYDNRVSVEGIVVSTDCGKEFKRHSFKVISNNYRIAKDKKIDKSKK